MTTETKLVNGLLQQSEKQEKPLPGGTQWTEVRIRHFYTNDDNGMVIMPTVVYFVKDGKPDADADTVGLIAKLGREITDQIPFPLRNLNEEEIAEELAKEITVGSLGASQGKAALAVFAKNLKEDKPETLVKS